MAVLKTIKLAKCNADGTIVANPVVVDLCVESEDLKQKTNYVDIKCLLKKTADTEEGSSTVEGGLTFNLTKQTAYLVHRLMLGDPLTNADAVTEDWAADTVYQVGDIVNHSDDKHTFRCTRVKGDAKSGSDEPTPTTTNSTTIVQDNNVTWESTTLLKKATLQLQDTATLVAVEFGIDDGTGGDIFYKRYLSNEFSNLPLSLKNEDKVPQMQITLKGNKAIDSLDNDWVGSLDTIAGAKLVTLGTDYYSANTDETTTLSLDGNYGCVDSFELTLDKGITVKKGLNECFTSQRDIKCSGKLSLNFLKDEYVKYKRNEKFEAVAKVEHQGCYFQWTVPTVKAERTDPDIQKQSEVLLSPNIKALSDPEPLLVEIVYPAFMADDGTLVDF